MPRAKPPTPVTLRIGPVALNSQRAPVVRRPTTVRHFLLPFCKHRPVQLRTTAPVAVELHVDDLALGTDFGLSDTRELGAQFSGSFKPSR